MDSIWHSMFIPGLSVAEKIIRPLIVYVFLIIGLRLSGKRELAQLNPFDLVVLLILSNTVQNAIIGNDNSVTGGLIGATTLLVLNYIVLRFMFSHERLERIVEGEQDALIENGVLKEERLKKELISKAELETAAHRQGFSSLAEVERAVLAPGGTIYFVGRKPPVEELRQKALTDRLDSIAQQLAHIRESLEKRAG